MNLWHQNFRLPMKRPDTDKRATITYAIIRLVGGISDIIMVLIIVLVSLFLIFGGNLSAVYHNCMEEEIKSIEQ